jgi:hypothetical protein
MRDRDVIYGSDFQRAAQSMGIEEVLTSPRSPWQNPFVERLIGSIRRECLDHVIVCHERSLRRHLRQYLTYYHEWRTHLSLDKDAPVPRAVHPPTRGTIVQVPHVGRLHPNVAPPDRRSRRHQPLAATPRRPPVMHPRRPRSSPSRRIRRLRVPGMRVRRA